MRGIARFHSLYTDSARLEDEGDLGWIVWNNDPIMCMTGPFMKIGWTKFEKRLSERLSEDLKKRAMDLYPVAQCIHDWMGSVETGPMTVVHGDCHLENCYKVPAENEAGFELGLYDMQLNVDEADAKVTEARCRLSVIHGTRNLDDHTCRG